MHSSTLRSIFSGFSLMDAEAATSYYPLIHSILTGNKETNFSKVSAPNFMLYGLSGSTLALKDDTSTLNDEIREEQKHVLVIPMHDSIIKYDEECGVRGTETIARVLKQAYMDESIAGIVISADSPGGDAYAVEKLSSVIAQRNKPVLCHVHGGCNSAMYWIASHCDEIHSNFKMSTIGSIGVYSTLMDMYRYYENQGMPIEMVYAEQSTEKNAMFREWRDSGKTDKIKADATKACNLFIDVVSKNRGIPKDSIVFKGASFETEDALSQNLIDGTLTFEEVIDKCFSLAENYSPTATKKEPMFGKNNTQKFTALIALAAMSAEERTPEAVQAVNEEFKAAGLEAILVSNDLGVSNNADIEALKRKAAEVDAAKLDASNLKSKLDDQQALLDASNNSLSEIASQFEGNDKEGFNLKEAVANTLAEHKTFSDKLDKGAGNPSKEGADEIDGNEPTTFMSDIELAEIEKIKNLI